MKYKVVLLVVFFCCYVICFGREETNNWYFGLYAGVDFNTDKGVLLYQTVMGIYCFIIAGRKLEIESII